MITSVEIIDGLTERIVTYGYPIKNFNPEAVRRSLRRAYRRAEGGPDHCVEVEVKMKDGAEVPPEIGKLGRIFENVTLACVLHGSLEIFDPDVTEEQMEEGEDGILFLPLSAVDSMRVSYRMWEEA